MNEKILKVLILFFIEVKFDKEKCSVFFKNLESLNISIEEELGLFNKDLISNWQTFSEYFLFEPELYASNYPVPELDLKEMAELEAWART